MALLAGAGCAQSNPQLAARYQPELWLHSAAPTPYPSENTTLWYGHTPLQR